MEPMAARTAPRGTRPRNRRSMILAAASELFTHQGYANTSMTDIAWAVGIGPSALYRHFPGKQRLLAEAIEAGLEPVRRIGAGVDPGRRRDSLESMAAHALEHRRLGLLWQREARHLPTEERDGFRGQLEELGAVFTERVRSIRPDLDDAGAELAAWALLSALASPALHAAPVGDAEYAAALVDVLAAILGAEYPIDGGHPPVQPGTPAQQTTLVPASRREQLLIEAVRLFARDGYGEVSLEDIGAAVGISAPSVYNHFPTKLTLLTTAFHRGTAALFTGVSAAYSTSRAADEALRVLLATYLEFAGGNHHLLGLLVTETRHLDAAEKQYARDAQRTYLREWTHLLRMLRPDFGEDAARVRVNTTIDVVNNTARMSRFRRLGSLGEALTPLCLHMLGIGAAAPDDDRPPAVAAGTSLADAPAQSAP